MTWYLINSVLRPTPPLPSVPSMLILDGKTFQGDADVQLELTCYFANIRKTTAFSASSATSRCDFRAYLGPSCLKSMVLNSFSEFEVARIVTALKGSSSSGPESDLFIGHLQNHFTEHACAAFMNFIHPAIDSCQIPAALFLDVRKTFDSLTHRILLSKLLHIGIRSNAFS